MTVPSTCTIIARNYVPLARVLARSFTEHHPGRRLTALVLDDDAREVHGEPFDVVRLDDLAEDPVELRRMAAIYDVLEMATAMKPWLFRLLFARGASTVMYLDPDMRVYGPLDDLHEAAALDDLVLTPHVTAPVPRDDRMVAETSLLGSGVYNLGFCAVGRGAGAFLDYWTERLRRDCINEPTEMRFVDQRWLDFAPGMFRCRILRDQGVNAAYWNLHERAVAQEPSGRWVAGGDPLRLFHFSGYTPLSPHLLSRHQGHRPRILLSERPDLARLCHDYGAELLEAGYDRDDKVPYGWAHAANGLALDRTIRRLLRLAVLDADGGAAPYPPDPFEPLGADRLVEWLNTPPGTPEDPGHLSLYLGTVYAKNLQLYRQFPDPQGADRERFFDWAAEQVAAGRLDERLVPPKLSGPAGEEDPLRSHLRGERWAAPDRRVRAVLVAGHLAADHEVGGDARDLLGALSAAGGVTSRWTWTAPVRGPGFGSVDVAPAETTRRDCAINVVCVEPDRVDAFVGKVGPGLFEGRYSVGRWLFPLEEFPAGWASSFPPFWEIWVPSSFAQRAVAEKTDKPVFVVPPTVAATAEGLAGRELVGLPEDRPLFVATADLADLPERSNTDGVLRAFRRAFPVDEGPVLALHLSHADENPLPVEHLRYLADGAPDIVLLEDVLDEDGRTALVGAADCYVSLHRAVAFGTEMARAMALGRPVVATAYSGNVDYMSPETAYLVGWEPSAVPESRHHYPAGARWAEPDLAEAARLLRAVAEDPAGAEATGERARRHVQAAYGPERQRRLLEERLGAIGAVVGAMDARPAGRRSAARALAGRVRRAGRVFVTGQVDGAR